MSKLNSEKKLKFIPTGERGRAFDCIGCFVSIKAIGWEWFVIEDHSDEGYYYGFVQSPFCPEGEFGSFGVDELKSIGAIFEYADKIMPPQNYVREVSNA